MSTTSTDPQSWLFPPPGVATPPVAATANFGPVHLGDSIIFDWSPATRPEIDMSCFSTYGSSSGILIAKLASPPLTYRLVDPAKSVNSSDRVFCHSWFRDSASGNSVTFEVINQVADKAVTWSRAGASSTSSSISPSGTSTTTTSSQNQASSQSQSTSATPPSSTSASAKGLSTGAQAGIGVGVSLGVILAAAVVLFFVFRRRKRQQRTEGPYQADEDVYSKGAATQNVHRAEMEDTGIRHELPGS